MIVIHGGQSSNEDRIFQEVDRLARLTGDLTAIQQGKGPTAQDLEAAPLLDNWACQARLASCLVGNASDHPMLSGSGRPIITSDLWVLAPDQGWARTLSRYYRLGRPLGAGLTS